MCFLWTQNLPPIPSPEVYGLHDNSGITRDLQASQDLFSTILLVQQSGGAVVGGSDAIVSAICDDIINKVSTAPIWFVLVIQ